MQDTAEASAPLDCISIKNIVVRPQISGLDKVLEGECTLSVATWLDTRDAALEDDLHKSVDYALLSTTLEKYACSQPFASVEEFLEKMAREAQATIPALSNIDLHFEYGHDGHGSKWVVHLSRKFGSGLPTHTPTCCSITLDHALIHIGVTEEERAKAQPVFITADLGLPVEQLLTRVEGALSAINDVVSREQKWRTLESLSHQIGSSLAQQLNYPTGEISISVAKPNALQNGLARLSITRDTFQHHPPARPVFSVQSESPALALLSIGSNIEPRFSHIENALRLLEDSNPGLKVLDTSFMYETQPMYVEDQARFANCACLIESDFSPMQLLHKIKEVEKEVGRVATFRHGPRAIDLDIVFYNDQILDIKDEELEGPALGGLTVPHPRAHERDFVLRPLADIVPTFAHPQLRRTILDLLGGVRDPTLCKVFPFPSQNQDRYWTLGKSTYLMATLNATPDSFSDGGMHFSLDDAMTYARKSIADGADIIDIGGYSTRPHASFVEEEEEIRRVVPIIQRIRNEKINIPISIDTFRSRVAREAIRAGADVINDVTALVGDPDMRQTAAELGVPSILMHSRGEASKNKTYGAYAGVVLEGVQKELGDHVSAALNTPRMRRWSLMVDPGIGFSKKVEDNLNLIRSHRDLTISPLPPSNLKHHSLREAREWSRTNRNAMGGMPSLIGTSRKSFLGSLIGDPKRPADTRDWATAAAMAASIQQGVDVVRIHNVRDMREVVKVADALWRKVVPCVF